MNKKQSGKDVLKNPGYHVKFAKNLLAKLWRRILDDNGMTLAKWDVLMERHLDDPREKIPNTGSARASERSNLGRSVLEDEITWNVFEKGIRFLRPVRAYFTVRLHWANGDETSTSIMLINNRHNDATDATSTVNDTPTRTSPFVSREAELVFYLTELDGETRSKFLGVTDEMFGDKQLANEWYHSIVNDIRDHEEAAHRELKAIYELMVDGAK